MADEVLVTRDGAVSTLVLNRAAKRNALTNEMYESLTAALHAAANDDEIGCVVIRGEGETFTAGNDIMDFAMRPPVGKESPVFLFLETLIRFEKPVVIGVHGNAVGIGTTMLFHADLVYASPSAVFALPFVDLALVPEAASSYLVPRTMGFAQANRLLMLGERFDAPTALAHGMISGIVDAAELSAHIAQIGATLASKPRGAMAQTKRLMRRDHDKLMALVEHEGAIFAEQLRSDEARAAFMAFMSRGSKG